MLHCVVAQPEGGNFRYCDFQSISNHSNGNTIFRIIDNGNGNRFLSSEYSLKDRFIQFLSNIPWFSDLDFVSKYSRLIKEEQLKAVEVFLNVLKNELGANDFVTEKKRGKSLDNYLKCKDISVWLDHAATSTLEQNEIKDINYRRLSILKEELSELIKEKLSKSQNSNTPGHQEEFSEFLEEALSNMFSGKKSDSLNERLTPLLEERSSGLPNEKLSGLLNGKLSGLINKNSSESLNESSSELLNKRLSERLEIYCKSLDGFDGCIAHNNHMDYILNKINNIFKKAKVPESYHLSLRDYILEYLNINALNSEVSLKSISDCICDTMQVKKTLYQNEIHYGDAFKLPKDISLALLTVGKNNNLLAGMIIGEVALLKSKIQLKDDSIKDAMRSSLHTYTMNDAYSYSYHSPEMSTQNEDVEECDLSVKSFSSSLSSLSWAS